VGFSSWEKMSIPSRSGEPSRTRHAQRDEISMGRLAMLIAYRRWLRESRLGSRTYSEVDFFGALHLSTYRG
jgi:hypothetical protein